MYQDVKNVKWIKCWGCSLPILVQVGSTIPIGTTVQCPRCGKVRPMDRGSFMKPSEISVEWKKEVLKSIGLEERDT